MGGEIRDPSGYLSDEHDRIPEVVAQTGSLEPPEDETQTGEYGKPRFADPEKIPKGKKPSADGSGAKLPGLGGEISPHGPH